MVTRMDLEVDAVMNKHFPLCTVYQCSNEDQWITNGIRRRKDSTAVREGPQGGRRRIPTFRQ